jgi:hypothetical protein
MLPHLMPEAFAHCRAQDGAGKVQRYKTEENKKNEFHIAQLRIKVVGLNIGKR